MKKFKYGLTFTELAVIMLIILILGAIAYPTFSNEKHKSETARAAAVKKRDFGKVKLTQMSLWNTWKDPQNGELRRCLTILSLTQQPEGQHNVVYGTSAPTITTNCK